MGKQFLTLGILFPLMLLISISLSGFTEIYRLEWGEMPDRLSHRSEACARYGPTDLHYDSGLFYLLDRENSLIRILGPVSNGFAGQVDVQPFTECFTVSNGRLAYYDGIEIRLFPSISSKDHISINKPESIMIVKDLLIHDDILYIRDENDYYRRVYDIKENRELSSSYAMKSIYQNNRFVDAFLYKDDFRNLKIFFGKSEINLQYDGYLGASRILYIHEEFIAIKTEEILSFNPISARELILIIDHKGDIINKINVPFVYYTYIPENIRVFDDKIYLLISSEAAFHILKHTISELPDEKRNALYGLFPFEYHYNHNLMKGPEIDPHHDFFERSESPITRTQIMANAIPYESVVWTATSSNISNGIVQLPDGSYIRTPAWVTAGTRQKVPYKWGGWTSLNVFLNQITAGKYAGDNYTSSVSWTDNHCVGVDCSGFVSRAWDTNIKYGTSTLVNISTAYSGFTQLKRGDIVNRAGSHVRLVVNDTPSGTVNTLEAASADWRVSYRNFTFTQLSDYVPRYFNWVIDDEQGMDSVVVRVKDDIYTLNVRSGPSTSHGVLTTVSGGQKFVAFDHSDGWYKLFFPSGEGFDHGWCSGGGGPSAGFLEGSQETGIVTVNVSSSLNVRSGPSTAYPVITTVTNQQQFAVLGSSSGWYKFSLPESTGYSEGWASGSYLALTPGGPKSPVGAEVISVNAPSVLDIDQSASVEITVRNIGSGSFSSSTFLKTSNPQNHASPLYHSSWTAPNTVLFSNIQVLPFQQHTYSFNIYGHGSIADSFYTQYLNFHEDGIGWFSDNGQNGPSDNEINFTVFIEGPNIVLDQIMPDSGTYDIGGPINISWECNAPENASMRVSIKRDNFPDTPGPDYFLLAHDIPNTGHASFVVPDGISTASDWRVWMAHNESGSFNSSIGNISIKQPVVFFVSDGIHAIEGAEISIDNVSILTNEQGIAQISLLHGIYEYNVYANNYVYHYGVCTIGTENTFISIILQEKVFDKAALSFTGNNIEGIWFWGYEGGNSVFNKVLPDMMAYKIISGDITGNGISELIIHFETFGLWYYCYSTNNWSIVTNNKITDFTVARTDINQPEQLIVSFVDHGLSVLDISSNTWSNIISHSAQYLSASNIKKNPGNTEGLILAFEGINALYYYDFQSSEFSRMLFLAPSQVMSADISGDGYDELVLCFPGMGVYIAAYDSGIFQYTRITTGFPDEGHYLSSGDIKGGQGDVVFLVYMGRTLYYCNNAKAWHLLAHAPFDRILPGRFKGLLEDDLLLSRSNNGHLYLRRSYCNTWELLAPSVYISSMDRIINQARP